MKRKYIEFAFLFFGGLLFLNACHSKPRIGLLMDTAENGRWAREKEYFIKKVKEEGGEVIFRASEGDASLQLAMAEEMLTKNVQVIVIVPTDEDGAGDIVKMAGERHVPVIAYDKLINNCPLACYIAFDNVMIGELQAEYLIDRCPRGKYAIIGGTVNENNSFLLRVGQFNVLQPYIDSGNIEIVFEQYIDFWSADEGYRLMKDCLQENRLIDALLVADDQVAGGAIKAIRESTYSSIPLVTGIGAGDEACRRIVAGSQTMTVYKPVEALAAEAAKLAMQMIGGRKMTLPFVTIKNGNFKTPAILLPAMEVDSRKIKLTINAREYFRLREMPSH